MHAEVEYRDLTRRELSFIGEIDRSEVIDVLYEQRGTELVARPGRWDAAPWDPVGGGDHSVAAQRRALEGYVDAGGLVHGAFQHGRLVGIAVVLPAIRPSIAQLAYPHVTREARGRGIGARLSEQMDDVARRAGATEIVVSATPSRHTVHFYLGRGYRPMAEPIPELLALEPEDVHLSKPL